MAKAEASVEELVGMIERGELRLPEMQRRYVWRSTRVRERAVDFTDFRQDINTLVRLAPKRKSRKKGGGFRCSVTGRLWPVFVPFGHFAGSQANFATPYQALRGRFFPLLIGAGFAEIGFIFASFTNSFSIFFCSLERDRLVIFICLIMPHAKRRDETPARSSRGNSLASALCCPLLNHALYDRKEQPN